MGVDKDDVTRGLELHTNEIKAVKTYICNIHDKWIIFTPSKAKAFVFGIFVSWHYTHTIVIWN